MEKITSQIKLLTQIVRCIVLKGELSKQDPNPHPHLHLHLVFWQLIHGGLLDLAVLKWTKVFGSNAEPTHWKGIVDDIDAFKQELLIRIDLNENDWTKYWNEMKTYRDEGIAHQSKDPAFTHYPKLDLALVSCYFYYDYLIAKARELGENKYPDSLEEYCDTFTKQTSSIVKLALDATVNCVEEAW